MRPVTSLATSFSFDPRRSTGMARRIAMPTRPEARIEAKTIEVTAIEFIRGCARPPHATPVTVPFRRQGRSRGGPIRAVSSPLRPVEVSRSLQKQGEHNQADCDGNYECLPTCPPIAPLTAPMSLMEPGSENYVPGRSYCFASILHPAGRLAATTASPEPLARVSECGRCIPPQTRW